MTETEKDRADIDLNRHILRRVEQLLGWPDGWTAERELYLAHEWPAVPCEGHPLWHDLVACWNDDAPSVAEMVAVTKAVAERFERYRLVLTHVHAGVLGHALPDVIVFTGTTLTSLDMLPEPSTLPTLLEAA